MVDIHCHILPALDDGAATIEQALGLARAAEASGIDTVVATPHIRHDFPFPIDLIPNRLAELRSAIAGACIHVDVIGGAEVALSKLPELSDDELAGLCIGEGRYLLVESPYARAPSLLEAALFDLQVRGFRPVLAHPERSVNFLSDLGRLERLVESGVLCSVTAMSAAGGFGSTVRQFANRLFALGLVHNIASDSHDATRRPPGFAPAFDQMDGALSGVERARWFVEDAPRALLDGQELPQGQPPLALRRSPWRRLRQGVGRG